jgi:hypothetical protein
MNIVKELHLIAKKNSETELNETETILNSVKENLSIEDKKDADMLSFFGTGEIVNTHLEKKTFFEKKLKSEHVNEEDIKKICCNYNLRFLKAGFYKKQIPISVLNDLRKFQEINKISKWTLQDNLMIIAPKSHFNLGSRPISDPVLLYRVGSYFNKEYKIISTWGNDFNFTRRISGFLATNTFSAIFIVSLILSLIFSIVIQNFWFMFSPIGILIFSAFALGDEIDTLDNNWNKPWK